MTSYQIRLLLEALVSIYSVEDLAAADSIVMRLVRYLDVEFDDAQALVLGACNLKELRMRVGRAPVCTALVQ